MSEPFFHCLNLKSPLAPLWQSGECGIDSESIGSIKKKRAAPIVLCLFLCTFPIANAFGRTQDGLAVSLGASVLNFDYREFNEQGRLLDRESGQVPGVMFEMSHAKLQWQWAARLAYAKGSTAYEGQTNTGVPVMTKTHQLLADAELRGEYALSEFSALEPRVYLGAAHHSWRRDIQPSVTPTGVAVSGLLETYQWGQVFGGSRITLVQFGYASWSFDVRVTRSIAPTILVDFAGQNDNPRLALGERWGSRLALPLRYSMRDSTAIFVEPSFDQGALGESDTVPLTRSGNRVGSIKEPESISQHFGLVVGVQQQF